MRNLGIVLLVLGVIALVYGGIQYNQNRTVLEVGSLSVTATEHKNIPIPAVVGLAILIGGGALVFANKRGSGSA